MRSTGIAAEACGPAPTQQWSQAAVQRRVVRIESIRGGTSMQAEHEARRLNCG